MTDDSRLTTQKTRLLSLDFFRGLTIAAMILVNDPGDWDHIYPPLEHSVWNGCTPTDLIFPFFLFMVGVSIVFAMQTKATDTANHPKMIWSALRRGVILIAISLFIQILFHGWEHLRYPGVLQRIGVVFFFSTIIYLKTTQRIRDYLFAGLLVGYYIIMVFVPVPDTGHASLDPATNMGAWLDRTVFTTEHLWRESHTWDPEGLLGTLPAIATCLFGIRLGEWLKRNDRDSMVKVKWMLIFGAIAVIIGVVWGFFFPINKALWSSSFVLYTGGWATLGLAFCYWLIDVKGRNKYIAFFVAFGTNAITAYVLSDFIPHYFNKISINGASIYQLLIAPHFSSPYNASLAGAILQVLLVWVLIWILYLRKIIIKV